MSYDGKGFEEILLWRAREIDEPARRYTMGRYGVMAAFIKGVWTPINSLPDFDGILKGGRQFVFDAKTCSQASYAMSGGTSKSFAHQYKFLRRRSAMGALTFLLIHWNERKLKGKEDPAFTTLFPVCDNAFWQAYDRGEQKQISRKESQMYGIPVLWDTPPGRSTISPDIHTAIMKLQGTVDGPQITQS